MLEMASQNSIEFRRYIASLTIPELLEAIELISRQTTSTIEVLAEEISLRAMELSQ